MTLEAGLVELAIGILIALAAGGLGFWLKGLEVKFSRKIDYFISEPEAIVRPNFREIRLEVDGATYDSVYAYYFWISNSGREVVENVRVDIDCPDREVVFIKEFSSLADGAKISNKGVLSDGSVLSFEYDYINPSGIHRMTFLASSENNFRIKVEGKGVRVSDFRIRHKRAMKVMDVILLAFPGVSASDLLTVMRQKGSN